MSKVMVIGVFDLFHRGHLEFLRSAARFGEEMLVVINGDRMVAEYKRAPIFSQDDRKEILEALSFVTEVVINGSFDVKPIVREYRPSVIVHGDDWPRESYLEQIRMTESDLGKYRVDLEFIPYFPSVSTSGIIQSIRSAGA